jgi:hypothetical protein
MSVKGSEIWNFANDNVFTQHTNKPHNFKHQRLTGACVVTAQKNVYHNQQVGLHSIMRKSNGLG